MRRRLVLLGALLLSVPLRAQVQPVPQVVVTGHGQVTVIADQAVVMLAVESREASAAAAGAQNARRMAAVRAALVAAGIPADSITTSTYSVQPADEYDDGRVRQASGYEATNVVHVRTRRLDQVGRIIDVALGAGANRVEGVSFSASNTADARRRALAQAIAAARADAEAMAAAGGGTLGTLLELATSASSVDVSNARVAFRGDAPMQTSINASDITVSAMVTARWRFIDR